MMASTLVHEMVFDPNNPMDKIVPFLFSSEFIRNPTPIFRWYLCFIDLNRVQDHIEREFLKPGNPQTVSFNKFCDVFQLRNTEDPMLTSDDTNVLFENQRTRDSPLFCRSAPWESCKLDTKIVKGTDFEDAMRQIDPSKEDKNFRTKFQIGFVMNP